MKKLSIIQSELKVGKSRFNSFGKYSYRSCEDIFDAVKPLLQKHNCALTVTDVIEQVGNVLFVNASATLKDNESEDLVTVSAQAGIAERKGMDIAQSFGASSSYARKYALSGLFLLDDVQDPDTFEPGQRPQPAVKNDAPPKQTTASQTTLIDTPTMPNDVIEAMTKPVEIVKSDDPQVVYNAVITANSKAELREIYKANKALFDGNQSVYNAMILRAKTVE